MHPDKCGNTSGQKCHAKASRKETKTQDFMYRYTTNVECAMYGYTRGNWSHRNSNKRFKEKFRSQTGKTFNRFTANTAVLGTSHIIRKVLQSETGSLSGGDHSWFKRSKGEKWPVVRDNMVVVVVVIMMMMMMMMMMISLSSRTTLLRSHHIENTLRPMF
jgi:hypothetical protein